MEEIEKLVDELSRRSHPNQIHRNFPAYIKRIVFPYFKNLEERTEIKFDFPLTVFVGPNGCGKSSALQALYGAPEGHSVGSYWFNTATDPIPEKNAQGLAPSLWYEYFLGDANRDVQVLKYRSKYAKGGKVIPDYWEPARPLPAYGLPPFPKEEIPGKLKTRWPGLDKHVIYLDFRAELSAFDKYFYFSDDPHRKKYDTKQDFIRYVAPKLKQVFDGKIDVHTKAIRNSGGKTRNLNQPCVLIEGEELKCICTILGKGYTRARVVNHGLYQQWGQSVYFEDHHKYTEAFAGSGEMSIVTLVHEVYHAPANSLILLDEPEVSLHPGAQKKMLRFLLEQIKLKKHQVVLCSHSPALIEHLPDKAIKLFNPTAEGLFRVISEANPSIAFSYIGQTIPNKVNIVVEDEAAKQLVSKVISLNDGWSSQFEVMFHPGGAADIYKEAVVFSRMNDSRYLFLLDGDQKRTHPINLDDVTDRGIDDAILALTGASVDTFQFANDSGANAAAQKVSEKRKFIQFINNRFRFLPGNDPEDTIILATTDVDRPNWTGLENPSVDSKQALKDWVATKVDSVDSRTISTFRQVLLKKIDPQHAHVVELTRVLSSFVGQRQG